MINIQSLSHVYEKGRQIKFPDWEIADMEQWLLLGASGSGKSTLLNIISGLFSANPRRSFNQGYLFV
jgi:putative ABC transport system ATP-binding protein